MINHHNTDISLSHQQIPSGITSVPKISHICNSVSMSQWATLFVVPNVEKLSLDLENAEHKDSIVKKGASMRLKTQICGIKHHQLIMVILM